MKIKTARTPFLHALQNVSTAVAARTTHPALSGILLQSYEGSVVATAYDLEIGIKDILMTTDDVYVEVVKEGSVVVPGKQLIDITRKLTGREIEIEAHSNNSITVRSGQFECDLHGMSSDIFPGLPGSSYQHTVVIPSIVLRELIKSTAFAASKSESRPILTGVCIEMKHGNLRFSATDSLRLATRNIPFDGATTDSVTVIIPSKSLVELTHILPDEDVPVSISIMQSHCMFEMRTLQFYTRIIEGTFVDVSRLVPQTYVTEVVVNTNDLICAVDRATVIAPRNQEVQLTVKAGCIFITTKSSDFGNLTDVVPTKSINGNDICISFNAKNVLEALRTFHSEETIVRLAGANQPFLLIPNDELKSVHVISPIITR